MKAGTIKSNQRCPIDSHVSPFLLLIDESLLITLLFSSPIVEHDARREEEKARERERTNEHRLAAR